MDPGVREKIGRFSVASAVALPALGVSLGDKGLFTGFTGS